MAKHTRQEAAVKNGKLEPKAPAAQPFTQPPTCPLCHSTRVWKDGLRYTENGDVQRYICRECGRRFSENPKPLQKPSYGSLNRTSAILLDRQVCVTETQGAKNLAEVEPPKSGLAGATKISEKDVKGKIIEYLWYLKRQGYAEPTIKVRTRVLKRLVKLGANLWDPENVKQVISEQSWGQGQKRNAKNSYQNFVDMEGLSWKPPKYKPPDSLPFIPLESELDQMINACGRKVSIFLQGLKETGTDPGELLATEWTDVNEETRTIAIKHPVKGHKARILPISKELMARFKLLPHTNTRIFPTTMEIMFGNYWRQRKNIARSFNNPRLQKITFTTFRHWKATIEYHKTRDILYVKELLGHKSLNSTMIYIDIEKAIYGQLRDDEFITRVATNLQEDRELIEAGFQYVTERDGTKIYKKRK